jgi:hypothetical protein
MSMLKTMKSRLQKRKNLKLKGTLGENIRDAIIKTGMEAAEKSGYAAGNSMEKFVEVATSMGTTVDLGTQLTAGGESASALGRIVFKATKDIAQGDTVCYVIANSSELLLV